MMSGRDQQINTGRARAPVAKRSSFYLAHAHPSARPARRDVCSLRLLPRRRRYRRRRRATAARLAMLDRWRTDIAPLYAGRGATGLTQSLASRCMAFALRQEDFLAIIDGMEMDVRRDIRAPDWDAFDLYCDRVASAVGRLSVKIFGIEGEETGDALSHHLGRALQMTNILRDLDEDADMRPALSSQRGSGGARASTNGDIGEVLAHPRLGRGLRRHRRRARDTAFCGSVGSDGALPAAERALAAHHGLGLWRSARRSSWRGAGPRHGRRFAPRSFNFSRAVLRYGVI